MVRTQVQLREDQAQTLRLMAREQQLSVAELIRRSIDLYLAVADEQPLDQKYERALALAGKYQDAADFGRNHDHYLADAFADSGG